MCGIIGVVGSEAAAPTLMDGLRRLEYRGYDSAGVATLVDGRVDRRRAEGKLRNLDALLTEQPLTGTVGIGHTRWATHGRPTTENAHPHSDGRVAVVHNGIIENFQELRAELAAAGHAFQTDTDTEVIVHLISHELTRREMVRDAVSAALGRLEGAFALAIAIADAPDRIFGARRGSPLTVGHGEGTMYIASDGLALAALTSRIRHLEEGDWVEITREGAQVRDAAGAEADRPVTRTQLSGALVGKGNHAHFMEKEIFEQPGVIGDTLHTFLHPLGERVTLPAMPVDIGAMPRLTLTACGTAYYAGMVARHWLEATARQPVELDIASEWRYRAPPLAQGGAVACISQSGETADTLGALRFARRQGQATLGVVNVPESSMAREAGAVLPTHAGPEIGVASTKAFTTQLTVLACFALAVGRARGALSEAREGELTRALLDVPARAAEVLNHDERIRELAHWIAGARDVLYLGRGAMYPLALEGALKLKEISYIHAEGFAGGEMKHGPIALIDENVPVIVAAPSTCPVFDKMAGNVRETVARGGKVVLLSDRAGIERAGEGAAATIELPEVDPFIAPLLYAIPVQLLAYHTAVVKGTDVDQPRNLAKSVTVE